MREYAPGIPEGKPIKKIRPTSREAWRMVLQEHPAVRAGLHTDIRIGDPATGEAHSWVTRKRLPGPGDRPIALYRQPTHTYGYMDYEGPILSGYGKTKKGKGVKKMLDEIIEVLESGEERVRFNVLKPRNVEEFLFSQSRKTPGSWYGINVTHTKEGLEKKFNFGKPSYKKSAVGAIDLSDDSQIMSAKIDGGHNIFMLNGGKNPRVFSHRLSKTSRSGVIEQSHKMPDLFNQTVPKELGETIVRGEVYATSNDTGAPVPAEVVSGMLNAGVLKSREMQSEIGKLKPAIFDIVKFKGQNVEGAPYEEKIDMMKEVTRAIAGMEMPSMARTPEEKKALLDSIQKKEFSETHEGVVLWPKSGGRPIKAKFNDTFKVFLRKMEEAVDKEGNPKGEMGSIWYSMSPRGPIVGKVGTGFSSSDRKDMWENQKDYLNKFAFVKAQVQYKSGALGKPSFVGIEKKSSMPVFEYRKSKKDGTIRAVQTSTNKAMTENFSSPDFFKTAERYVEKYAGFREQFARYVVPGIGKSSSVEYRVGEGMKSMAVGGNRIVKTSEDPSDPQKAVGIALTAIGAALLMKGGNPMKNSKNVGEFFRSVGDALGKSPEAAKSFGRLGLTGLGAYIGIKGLDRL